MFAQARKAVYAAALWFLGTGAISTVLEDNQITIGEVLTILIGTPIAGVVVYKAENAPAGE